MKIVLSCLILFITMMNAKHPSHIIHLYITISQPLQCWSFSQNGSTKDRGAEELSLTSKHHEQNKDKHSHIHLLDIHNFLNHHIHTLTITKS